MPNNKIISPKRNDNKINKKFIKNNEIEPLLLSQLSNNNNISSTIFSDINLLSQNKSISPSEMNEQEKNNLANKINYYNLKNIFGVGNSSVRKRKDKAIYTFKNTEDFIQGLKIYYSKINVKSKLSLKNLSSHHFNSSVENKTQRVNSTRKKKIFLSNGNSPSNAQIQNYLYNDGIKSNIQNISNYITKHHFKQKKRESKIITFEQIAKNSNIYSSELL